MVEPPVVAGTKSVMERLTQPVETLEQTVEVEEQPILTESAAPEESELGQPEGAQKETHVNDVTAGDRKNIPPKKNRMEPLKMDMSRPPKMVTPLTSSQISLQCLECHIIFSDHKSKERHLKQSHPAEYEQCMLVDALFACYVCDRQFTNSSDLMLHQRAHTEKTPFKCPICGEAFSRSSELTLHKKLHFGLYGYTCSDCGKPCKTLTLLKYHRRTHTGERPYACKECGKRFSMSKALQKHALAHSPEGMKGEVGGITPPTKAQLKKNSGTAVGKFSCSVCKATFKTAKTRLHHMKHKHNLCVTASSSSSTTLAGQQVKPGQPIITQVPMGQPTFLHMEPLGPFQQVDNIDTEQIRKLIESLGNVRKVNQVVILGQVPPHGQPLELQRLQGKREHLQFRFTQPQFIELKKIGGGETKSMGLEQAKPQCESLEPIITLEPVISDGQMETPLLSHTQEVTYAEHAGLTQTHEGEMIPQQLLGQTGQTVEEENTMIQTVSVEQVFCHSETVELGKTTEQSQTVVFEVTPSLIPTLELEQTQTDQQGLMSASSLPTFLFERTSGQNQRVQEGNISVPSLIPTVELKLTPFKTDQQEELSTSSLVPTVKFAQTPPGQTTQVGETATQMETLQLDQIYSSIGQTQQTGIGQRRSVEKPLLENTENEQQHILEKPYEGKKQTAQEQLQTLIDKSASNKALNSREMPRTQTSEIFPPPSETKKAPQSSQLPVHLMSVQEFVKVRKRKQPKNSIMQGNMQPQTVELEGEPAKRPRATKAHLVVKFGPKEKEKLKNQKKLPQPSKLLQKGDPIQDMNQMSLTTLPEKKLFLKVGKEKKVKKKNYISKSKIKSPTILCDPHVQQVLQVDEPVQQVKPRKKKVKKQNYVISETFEQIRAEPISEQEVITPPKPKKKKQEKIQQEDQSKKTKGQKLSKTGRKKKKPNVETSPISEDMPDPEIKQQSLLLLKGHKQPQLKVYKLDASKAPQGQTDLHQDTHPIHKKKGPKSKQLKMLAAGGGRKVGRPKKNHTALSVLAPLKTTSHSSDTSPTKPKTSRKRKGQKVETEGIISGSHSRRALECKDCGERFSDVSSLQEHKAALHAVESPGLTYTNGNIFEGVSRSDLGQPPLNVTEEVIENSLRQNTFGMQVASDWDMEVEMREIGLGERGERVSFPALNPSPSLPLAAALVEGGQKEREKNMDKTAEGMESFSHMAPNSNQSCTPPQVQFPYLAKSDKVQPLLFESLSPPHLTPIAPLHSCHQTEDTKSESQGNMNETADALIPTVSGFEHLGPIEDEIKKELLLEVDLVTVGDGDQNEGEHQSSPHEDSSPNEGSSLHENNRTHALPAKAQIGNVNRTVTTQNVQTESCPSDPLEIKQEEEEIMVQRREVEKRGVGRKNYTRGRRRGVGRGRRGSATRKGLGGEGMREMEPEKEIDECQVVYQLYSLNNDTEIKDEADVTTLHPGQSSPISLQTEIRSISVQNMLTAPCPSGSFISPLEEDPEDQVVFELESVTTSVVEVLKTEDGMVMKGVAGDQDDRDTGQSPGIILERFLTSRQREAAVGENGVVLMADLRGQEVKVEENNSDLVPVPHNSHARHTVEQRGVRMYLVKQENNLVLNDPQVSQGQSQLNVEHSSTRQCIFYPVKEERELLEEPSQSEQGVPALVEPGEAILNHPVETLSTTNPAVEEYEVNRSTAKFGSEINEYGEGELDFEQQDTEELVDFLLQNSDEVESEVVECSDPQPDPEAVVMACYHDSQSHASLHSNYIPYNLPTTESQARSGSMGGSQTGTGYRKPIDYFSKYFGWDAWAEIAGCTNKVSHLSNPVTAKEVAQFVGIHIAMGTLKFPSLKLYWQDFTRVPLVADTMSASRFSQLSCKLQLASPAPAGDPMDTQEAGHSGNPDRPKEGDPTRNPLRALHTSANPTVGTTRGELDGSGHTLTRGHSQIQALSSKSVSAKSTTQTSTIPHSIWQRCGDIPSSQDCFSLKTDPLWRVRPLMDHVRAGYLMLRREGDHGVDQYPLPLTCRAVNNKRPSLHSTVLVRSDGLIIDFNLSLDLSNKEATVEKMVPRDGMVYLCKQELSTPAMLEHLLGSGVHGAGKVGGAKGQMGDEFVSSDGRLMLHRYHLGFILSTVGKAQQNMASLIDSFEKAQKAVSLNRDLLNLYHSPLSASAPSSWPQAVLWYLTDLALVNSWMQYRQDHVPLPEPLNLMAFRLEVSKALILSSGSDTQDAAPPHPPPQKLHSPGTAPDPGLLQDSPLPDVATRYDGLGHWPEQLGEGEGGRCRFGGCERMSRVRCLKCCVFLCISRNHNCFLNFHSQGSF
ncbi:zinc finger protein 576, tandem duplicate 1 isoform X2 [Salvelinus alpinus]|uniref:zinc finger protein 576, tandem duplicate 1 isoform X2 n=1 Tax=Salvelinus alpinus TaxID=8036 RepID=UPI0039FD92FD